MALERLRSFEDVLQSVIDEGIEDDENVTRARDLLERLPALRNENNNDRTNGDHKETHEQQTLNNLQKQISVEDTLVRSISYDDTSCNPIRKLPIVKNSHSSGVYSWGRSDIGTLLRPNAIYDLGEKLGLDRIRQISSNQYHSAACSVTGEVYVAGLNIAGQICQQGPRGTNGNNNEEDEIYTKPKLIESLLTHRICQVSCGVSHTACVTAQGLCITFGSNECGELGHSKPYKNASLQQLSNVKPAIVQGMSSHLCVEVACGDKFTIIVCHGGEVYGCGTGSCNGMNHGRDVSRAERVQALIGVHVKRISATYMHTVAITSSGMVYGWGVSSMLGIIEKEICQEPTQLQIPHDYGRIVGASTGYKHTVLWTDKGQLLGVGLNKHGQLGLPSLPVLSCFTHIPLPDEDDYCIEASCGANHTLVLCKQQIISNINDNGNDAIPKTDVGVTCTAVYAFGMNHFGQVDGEQRASLYRQPIVIEKLDNVHVLRVFAGGDQSFAIGVHAGPVRDGSSDGFQRLLTRSFSYESKKMKLAPVSTDEFMAHLTHSHDLYTSPGHRNIVFDILSSAAILNNSFYASSAGTSVAMMPFDLDVDGLERCYVALLKDDSKAGNGHNNYQKLIGALNTALDDITVMMKYQYHDNMAIRIIMMVWQCPLTNHHQLGPTIMKRICAIMQDDTISSVERKFMIDELAKYPKHIFLSRLVDPLHAYLSHLITAEYLTSSSSVHNSKELSIEMIAACNLMTALFLSNCSSTPLVPHYSFYNHLLNNNTQIIQMVIFPQYVESINRTTGDQTHGNITTACDPKGFCKYPFLISVENKRDLLMHSTRLIQQQAQSRVVAQSIFQGVQSMPYFIMNVDRRDLVRQAMNYCENVQDHTLKMPLKIVFNGEDGIDEGGVKKEFFQLLVTQLFDVRFGMFTTCGESNRYLWFNKDCVFNLEEYKLIGILIGLAVYNEIILSISLPKAMYKKILNQPLKFIDVYSVDPALYEGLQKLLTFEPSDQVEDIFCLDHEVVWQDSLLGQTRRHALVNDGANVPVTGENRDQYVEAYTHWTLTHSIAPQFNAFIEGFTRVVPPSAMFMFLPLELELLLTGYPHLDMCELQKGTQYVGWNDETTTDCIKWFWEIINEFSLQEKQKFLKFFSGSEKAPIEGLGKLNFILQRMGPSSNLLPTSHTCFNTLLLPEYSSKPLLEERLKKAIDECEGFGLK